MAAKAYDGFMTAEVSLLFARLKELLFATKLLGLPHRQPTVTFSYISKMIPSFCSLRAAGRSDGSVI